MKRILFLVLAIAMLLTLAVTPVLADNGEKNKKCDCTKIQDGVLLTSDGEVITTGYDKWGYNYQAHLFNGG